MTEEQDLLAWWWAGHPIRMVGRRLHSEPWPESSVPSGSVAQGTQSVPPGLHCRCREATGEAASLIGLRDPRVPASSLTGASEGRRQDALGSTHPPSEHLRSHPVSLHLVKTGRDVLT